MRQLARLVFSEANKLTHIPLTKTPTPLKIALSVSKAPGTHPIFVIGALTLTLAAPPPGLFTNKNL